MTQQISTTDIRPGTYLIDPVRSSVRFTATHVFGLRPVEGTFTVRSGTVVVAEEPRRSTVSAELDAGSFTTGDHRRDADVRGKHFLDAARWPAIGFRSTRLDLSAPGPKLIGELSARGGSGEVTLDIVDVAETTDGYRITATGTIDRVAAGVAAGRAIIARYLTTTIAVHVTTA